MVAHQEIERFSDRSREALIRMGFVIFPLTGQSVNSLKADGLEVKLPTAPIVNLDEVVNLRSRLSEVGFRPGTGFSRFGRQSDAIAYVTSQLNLSDVEIVVGNAADYLELAFGYKPQGFFRIGELFSPTSKEEMEIRRQAQSAFSSSHTAYTYSITSTLARLQFEPGRVSDDGSSTVGQIQMLTAVGYTPRGGIGIILETDLYKRNWLTRVAPLVVPHSTSGV